jgi:hypothetical protein
MELEMAEKLPSERFNHRPMQDCAICGDAGSRVPYLCSTSSFLESASEGTPDTLTTCTSN